jgi:hypothetical protein
VETPQAEGMLTTVETPATAGTPETLETSVTEGTSTPVRTTAALGMPATAGTHGVPMSLIRLAKAESKATAEATGTLCVVTSLGTLAMVGMSAAVGKQHQQQQRATLPIRRPQRSFFFKN